jgi:UDP-3-O-acyl-N-acetylglucosamine deacetylase
VHPIVAKITSPLSQGTQSYVTNQEINNIATFFNMSELPSSDGSLKFVIKILRAYGLDQLQANNKIGLKKHRSKTKVVLGDLEE